MTWQKDTFSSGLELERKLHNGYELRVQVWRYPNEKEKITYRWDVLSSTKIKDVLVEDIKAFGYCKRNDDAKKISENVSEIYFSLYKELEPLTEFLKL